MKLPLAIGSMIASMLIASNVIANELPVIGWTEPVRIFPGGLRLLAKIDTGAKTSSIHVPEFKKFMKDGEEWIEFEFVGNLKKKAVIRRPLFRVAGIKDLTGPSQARPVIMLGLCIAGIYKETQVTLFDRSGFNFRMLIGRRYLENNFIVDVSKRRTSKPDCKDAPKQ